MTDTPQNRRDFLKATGATVATGLVAGAALSAPAVNAAGSDTIKVGLIGCGGRGKGALENVLSSAPGVQIVALGDAFKDRLDDCRSNTVKFAKSNAKVEQLGNKVDITDDHCYVGLDAYERVINSGANYIILATPPGFRPIHLQAAIAAGRNIFTEKPVAVDGPGIRKVLDAYEDAKKKNLAIVAGTQRRHQLGYLETMKRIHDGEIGDVVGGRAYWNQGVLWCHPRQKEWSDLVYQMRNWYNFVWLCGDHIVEQHIHNLDVINWATGAHPVAAVGMGSRIRDVKNPQDFGHIFDNFAIDYEYPKSVHILSMCRQINNCWNSVSEAIVGTKGSSIPSSYTINGKRTLTRDQDEKSVDPYVQEHTDLIASIRKGEPLNELKQVAESTLTAIMGRMSAYTGKRVTWEMALHSQQDTMPPNLDWTMSLQEPPVAVPGKTPFV
jgi:predicted dehydrogenase